LPQVLTDPSLLETDYAFDAALWFFKTNNLFEMAKEGVTDEVIARITRRVNGGYKGLDHRTKETHKIYGWLNV
jgi:putative chitinase